MSDNYWESALRIAVALERLADAADRYWREVDEERERARTHRPAKPNPGPFDVVPDVTYIKRRD